MLRTPYPFPQITLDQGLKVEPKVPQSIHPPLYASYILYYNT